MQIFHSMEYTFINFFLCCLFVLLALLRLYLFHLWPFIFFPNAGLIFKLQSGSTLILPQFMFVLYIFLNKFIFIEFLTFIAV